MIEIISVLSNAKFLDIKHMDSAKDMWDKLIIVYGSDDHVHKVKVYSLWVKYDEIRMQEDEDIAQYNSRMKEVVASIKEVVINL